MIIVLFLLNGCVSLKPAAEIKIPAPADLTQPCSKLPAFKGKDMQDIVSYTENLIKLYKVCQTRQSALINVVK